MDVREKLLDLIIDAKRTDPETGSFTEYLADHLISNGVTVQRWISVKDKLPPYNRDVLVYRPNMAMKILVLGIIEMMTTNGMKIGHYLEKMQTATLLLHTGHICPSRRKENDYG